MYYFVIIQKVLTFHPKQHRTIAATRYYSIWLCYNNWRTLKPYQQNKHLYQTCNQWLGLLVEQFAGLVTRFQHNLWPCNGRRLKTIKNVAQLNILLLEMILLFKENTLKRYNFFSLEFFPSIKSKWSQNLNSNQWRVSKIRTVQCCIFWLANFSLLFAADFQAIPTNTSCKK